MSRGKKELYLTGEKTENKLRLAHPLYEGIYKSALSSIFSRLLAWTKEKQTEQDYDNIIVFAGERGSGKTTALLDFCRELKKNDKKLLEMLDDEEMKKQCGKELFRFYCLDMIELSMLEKNEDIFELTLAKMLEQLEGIGPSGKDWMLGDSSGLRAVYRQFDKVYKSYNGVKYKKQMEEYGESSLSMLKNLSSSLGVKKDFALLLEGYFACIGGGNGDEKSVLVIPFDDLDLNIEHGYEMLENIYRYMRHSNVIVLLAIEPKQMEYICKNYILNASRIRIIPILNAFEASESFIRKPNEVEEHCEKLAKDYLKKILPLDARIYMPDVRSDMIRVVGSREEIESAHNREMPSCSQKMFILGKYADKTGIYYDACGRKRHFCELDTIRTLVDYSYFLDSLKDVKLYNNGRNLKQWKKLVAEFRENYEKLYGDIVNRMASEMLSGNNKIIFEKLLQEDVSRWGRFVYRQYLEFVGKESLQKDGAEEMSYCYGDLLKSFYHWGRYDGESKPLIHMMLALFSLKFTKEFVHYCLERKKEKNEEETDKIKYKDRLEGLLGRSIGGEWANELLPKVSYTSAVTSATYGYIPNRSMQEFVSISFILYTAKEKGESEILELQSVLLGIKERKLVKTLEMIGLFFTNIRDSEGKQTNFTYYITCGRDKYVTAEGEEYQVVLQINAGNTNLTVDFDVLGPLKGIDLEKTSQALTDNIFVGIESALRETYGEEVWEQGNAEITLKEIQDEFKKRWEDWGDIVPIPYYNLDLTYNIFKRVRQKALREIPVQIWMEDSLRYIVNIYQMLGEELSQEVRKYEEINMEEDLMVIRDNFLQYPLIKELMNWEEELAKGFGEYIGRLVKSIVSVDLVEAV